MKNDNFTLEDLRIRLRLPDVDLDLLAEGNPPRASSLKMDTTIPQFLKDIIMDTMKRHGVKNLLQWITYSLIIVGVYDDCIDYRLIQMLEKQWEVETQQL